MKIRVKLALLAISTGMFALATGSCFFRFLGDALGDFIAFRNID